MQEAQYGSPGVRELMGRVAQAGVPCLAIMNMPPLPYLQRIPGLRTETLEPCYADPRVWDGFDPALTTLASPDPQAFRPPDQPKNVLQVGLPTNFKAARFGAAEPTALLRQLEADIEAARFDPGGGPLEIPVKLKVHDSLFVPLAKWPMLIAGNYRCIRRDDMISIKEAVHANIDRSREIYDWVWKLCIRLGAEDADMVPFEKYAKAAEGLAKPSSAARRFLAAPSTSSGSTAWCVASPANKDCSPRRWTRSSPWWTSAWQRTARPDPQSATRSSATGKRPLRFLTPCLAMAGGVNGHVRGKQRMATNQPCGH